MTIDFKYFRYPPFSSGNDNRPQINAACGYFGNILIIYNMLIYRGMKSPIFVHNDVDVVVYM